MGKGSAHSTKTVIVQCNKCSVYCWVNTACPGCSLPCYQISVECEEYRGRERVEKGVGGRGCSMEKEEETNVYVVFKRVNGKQRREISVLLLCTTHLVTGQSQFQDRRTANL